MITDNPAEKEFEETLYRMLYNYESVAEIWVGQSDNDEKIAIVTIDPTEYAFEEGYIKSVLENECEILHSNEGEAMNQPIKHPGSIINSIKSLLGVAERRKHKKIKYIVKREANQNQ